jgi:hypothetical protein
VTVPTNVTPTPGAQPGVGFSTNVRTAARTPIEFDFLSELDLAITITSSSGSRVARDASGWRDEFQRGSARTEIVGGFHYSVLPFGGWADGGANLLEVSELVPEAATMTASQIEAVLASAGRLYLPKGTYTVDRTVVLPSDCTITGVGKGTIIEADGDFPIFASDTTGAKPENTTISFLTLRHTNTLDPAEAVSQSLSNGIELWGDNHNVHNVWIENAFVALKTAEQTAGDTANFSTDLVLENVRCSHENPLATTSQYGINLYSIIGFDAVACEWRHAWLDGIKLTKNVRDWRFAGGCSSDNGQVKWVTGAGAGDGIDGFGGACDGVLDGVTFADNGGNGIVFKTVGIQLGTDFRPYGPVRNIKIKNCTIRGDHTGGGIALDAIYNSTSTQSGSKLLAAEGDDRPRLSNVTIEGCTIEGTDLAGIYINCLGCSVSNTTIRSAGLEGVRVMENARDVSLSGIDIQGCSAAIAGDLPAVTVEGGAARVSFDAVRMHGKEWTGEIVDDSDYAALTTLHRSGIEIFVGSTDVVVEETCTNIYTTSVSDYDATAVVITSGSWADERIVLHHKGTETTGNSRYQGGPGSTYRNVAAGAEGHTLWIKEVGDPDTTSGWVPSFQSTLIQTLTSDGAVLTTTKTTLLNVSGTRAYTQAAGTWEGHLKTLECVGAASSPIGVVTGTYIRGVTAYTTITFTAVGQAADLEYHATGGWRILRVRPDTATGAIFPVIA